MTREEAIRRLESIATDLTGACVEAQSDKVSEYIASKIQAVDMAIAALKEQDVTDINVGSKWISVKDRLPKPLTKVLAINKYGDMMVGTYTEWGWMFPSYFEYITHWMKLPEPPKGE